MKKCLALVIAVFIMATFLTFPVSAAENNYDSRSTGRVTIQVVVPEGFSRVVYVNFLDMLGGVQAHPILPESDYCLVLELISGAYFVSGFVENDLWLEYIVTTDVSLIEVSSERNTKITLTVTGGPKEGEETGEATEFVTEPQVSESVTEVPDETTEPETTFDATEATEDKTGPSERVKDIDSDESEEVSEKKPFWISATSSILISAVFVVTIVGLVCFVRQKFSEE